MPSSSVVSQIPQRHLPEALPAEQPDSNKAEARAFLDAHWQLHFEYLRGYVRKIVPGKPQDQEEILQAVALKAQEYLVKYGVDAVEEAKIRAWFSQMVHHEAINQWRSRKVRGALIVLFSQLGGPIGSVEEIPEAQRHVPQPSSSKKYPKDLGTKRERAQLLNRPDPQQVLAAFREELQEMLIPAQLKSAILMASEDQLICFALYRQGYLYKEIAEFLAIPVGTVRTRIFSFRRRVRNAVPELQD